MPNYRPVFIFANGERANNAQVFATKDAALDSARDRFQVWTMPKGYDVEETDDVVTYVRFPVTGDVSLRLLEEAETYLESEAETYRESES